jgi:uncharacterized protein (DUF885 family)
MTTAASLLAEVVTHDLARNPTKAARLGLAVADPLLPDVSVAAVTAAARDDQAWLARLSRRQPRPSSPAPASSAPSTPSSPCPTARNAP